MVSPRWRKILRDLLTVKGRLAMMVLAIAVGIFGVGTILSAYTILTREISRNYLETNPASAFIELDRVDNRLVEAVRQRPGIGDAEASSTVVARVQIKPDEWIPLMLFVVSDFQDMRMNKFERDSGAWPPPEGTVLIERTGLSLVGAKVGESISIQTPNGSRSKVVLSGLVHDPSLAPSWQEQTAYGYVSPSTLVKLGENRPLNILKIRVSEHPYEAKSIEHTVSGLAEWIKGQGYTIEEIRVPPPGKHPHQSQMTAILVMLILFSLLALTLSAILTAALIGGLLAQQVRQIGVMKAIGARSWQIARLYLALVILLSLVAILLGLPPGIAAGRGFANAVADLLNFTIADDFIPLWVFLVQLASGLLVPVLVAFVPIYRSTRITVREAINDFGVSSSTFGSRRLDSLLGKLRGLDRTLILALRNTFRRRSRLLLTLGLLAAAGGMFMTSLNVKTAWETNLAKAAADRHYDLEIRLNRPELEDKLKTIVSGISGVQQVEAWNYASTGPNRPDGLEIVRTYPDGGHASFTLRSVPEESKLVQWTLQSGRWLQPGDTNAVVLNHTAQAMLPSSKVGESILLNVEGKPAKLLVVGIVKEFVNPATAYVNPDTFASVKLDKRYANALRVAMIQHDQVTLHSVTKEIERVLEKEQVSVKTTISETMLDDAISGHIYILIFSLIFMSVLMAIVGALGLMSTMSSNVLERTREFGVMRTIGGRSSTVLRNVISEGILIGLMSGGIALVLSLPLTMIVGNLVGKLAFLYPLPLEVSLSGIGIWLMVIVLGSMAASAYPAQKAARLTIRETLKAV